MGSKTTSLCTVVCVCVCVQSRCAVHARSLKVGRRGWPGSGRQLSCGLALVDDCCW